MMQILVASLGMGVLGLFWALVIVTANKFFHVDENPLTQKVIECLPGVNCGACGFAGCGAFGEAIVEEDVDPAECPVGEEDDQHKICKMLGRELSAKGAKTVAVLHCRGSEENVKDRAYYFGASTCASEHITGGGGKACTYGCLGLADCVKVCVFDALEMGDDGLPKVDPKKCTACGKCVDACPRGLFKLLPCEQTTTILCSSQDPGPISNKACKTACIACGICAKLTESKPFKMDGNLAVVDFDKVIVYDRIKIETAVEKCPKKIIRS